MARALKVFRTAIGFRDAYVAAPSKAAALRAWGTDKDLFARGAAELVTDPALGEEALNKPGEVVYRTRGSLAEQVAALGELPARKAKKGTPKAAAAAGKSSKRAEPKPKPSRAKLEAAEKALESLQAEQAKGEAAMRAREKALAAERARMEERFAKALAQAKLDQEQARRIYEKALSDWEP